MADLTLKEIKKMVDKDFESGQVTRERGADDLVFYWVTNWDENILNDSQLSYRGEFNIIRKAGRQIMSDLAVNEVQVDFEPKPETRDDAAELADGLYRAGDKQNTSQEAYATAQEEIVVCGVGAWELYTEYVSLRNGTQDQVIKRKPINEANNVVIWDANSKLLDKSNAKRVTVLRSYTYDGYLSLVEELTGEARETIDTASFKNPEESYVFPWLGGEAEKFYVGNFYHVTKIKEKILELTDPAGETRTVRESDIEEIEDELLDYGYEITDTKEVERFQVKKYIVSGSEILDISIIAGENLPIIPVYGERAYIEGEEHYEGVTRLAKDPQRLINFQLSYLADIVSRSPRQKPIFFQEQIATFEDMYSLSGSENNFPYLLQNRKAGDNTDLPIGPVGIMPEQKIPDALIASVGLSRQAVEDVANPGIPQNIADPDISGKAALVFQGQIEKQSVVYQEHMKHAKRRDAEVWVSMAAEIHDVPREVTLTLADGGTKTVQVMETVIDEETGNIVTINDLNSSEFDVYSKIGPSFSSQKEQTLDRIEKMMAGLAPGDQMRNILMLKQLILMDGVDFDDVRDYANSRLVIMGIKKPETPEEEKLFADMANQGDQPSAEMILAQGELLKGQAAMAREKISGVKLQLEYKNENVKRLIDQFEAETNRRDTQIDAQEAGAKIRNTDMDTLNKEIEAAGKVKQLQLANVSSDDLFKQIAAG